ncbi:ceramide kinase-like [Physella acuta]|uniref:ceramide kinase-like n=1 Tax=Physella acuta TaxID=109671 RepID=UPI0027DAF146|nr:ceramide kinase-like [Physella acuta]
MSVVSAENKCGEGGDQTQHNYSKEQHGVSLDTDTPTTEGESNDTPGEIILEGTVKIAGKEKHMQLKANGLEIAVNPRKDKSKVMFIPLREVISASIDTTPSDQQNSSFVVHHVQHKSNCSMKVTSLKIEDLGKQAERWVSTILDQCLKVDGRPHKLFVLINPIGGAGRARQIYHKSVAPIFELAQIATKVKETDKSKHALEIGETQDFSSFDGVVLVGGDGLYQEFLQGLTIQTQKKAGVNYHSPDTKFVPTPTPIGIIPAGTGNGVGRWINGSSDPETSALSIVRGEQHRGQILTVHSDDKFICVSAMMLGYGLFSEIIKRSEELRWMKRARYAYVLLAALLKTKRVFKCELAYRVSTENNKSVENANTDTSTEHHQDEEWSMYTKSNNHYCGISCGTLHTKSDGGKQFLSPFATHVQLGIDSGCGKIAMFRNMFHITPDEATSSTPSSNLEFINNVTAFKIKVLHDEPGDNLTQEQARVRELERIVNADGEIVYVDNPDILVRLHVAYVALYGRDKIKQSFW